MPEPIDILENRLLEEDPELLRILLQDRTTGQPILWATDSYSELGEGYHWHDPIRPDAITGEYGTLIMPRVAKSTEEQRRRSKQMAEVFTPSWLVNQMCNALDEEWFGRPNVFNTPLPDHTWQPPEGLIRMPEGQTWVDYVLSPRLEITCGEAPFLVSRYDTVTGDVIPLSHRIGLLDRKLRIVGEQCPEEEWTRWALLALGSIYGYEWQGDNLLIAREALLATFSDYYEAYHHHAPSRELRLEAAEIISWNLWQMDGLKGVVPDSCHEVKEQNFQSLFGDEPTDQSTTPCPGCEKGELLLHNGQRCQLRRWIPSEEALPTPLDFLYTEILTKQYKIHNRKRIPMKFDFVIANPPYQEDVAQVETANGQHRQKSIFQYFQQSADQISKQGSCLIYPGGRWLQRSGKGMAKFGLDQINDPHLSTVEYYPEADDLFGNSVSLSDGITIVTKDYNKTQTRFNYRFINESKGIHTEVTMESPGREIIVLNPAYKSIMDKIDVFMKSKKLKPLHHRVLPQKLFRVESDFVEKNPEKVELYENQTLKSDEIKLLTNDKAGKAGRAKWYVVKKDVIDDQVRKYISQWKVIVSSANAGGQKRDNQIDIADNKSAFGRSRIALGSFKTKKEATNFLAYCKSYVIRFAFLMTDEALTSLAKRVPDLGDYSSSCPLIDFDKSIDAQLMSEMGFTEEEKEVIISTIDSIDKSRGKL